MSSWQRQPYIEYDVDELRPDFVPNNPLRRRITDWLILGAIGVALMIGGVIAVGFLGYWTSGAAIEISNVDVGTCFNTSNEPDEDTAFPLVWRAECAAAHRGEVVGRLHWPDPDAAHPSERAFELFAAGCIDAFRSYVGIDYDLSELQLSYTYPNRDAWGSGLRSTSCVVFGPGSADLTGTVRSSGR